MIHTIEPPHRTQFLNKFQLSEPYTPSFRCFQTQDQFERKATLNPVRFGNAKPLPLTEQNLISKTLTEVPTFFTVDFVEMAHHIGREKLGDQYSEDKKEIVKYDFTIGPL